MAFNICCWTSRIKYYQREGLLPPGVHTHPNQVDYDDGHADRLRLIRALIDIGGMSASATADLLAVLDATSRNAWQSLGEVQHALANRRKTRRDEPDEDNARRIVDALLERRGWAVDDRSPAHRVLVDTCITLRQLGHDDVISALDDYAEATEAIATIDTNLVKSKSSMSSMTETMIIATTLGDTMLSALRQLAQEHVSRPILSQLKPRDD
ncbi:MerR family transcriptional regulator [Mycolicibacterium houstonense]|uniref:MerR family transcriptional regulator n=1 Tax=Mycolicibacterium houstonense TaxID=146021 RepID=UPI000AB44037|nr:MerR family transcriptional regulator [Mycolicibacterium houstonense]